MLFAGMPNTLENIFAHIWLGITVSSKALRILLVNDPEALKTLSGREVNAFKYPIRLVYHWNLIE